MEILTTNRLLLREFTTDDAPFIFKLVNTPSWLQFIGDRGVHSMEDARKYLENGPIKSYRENGFGLSMIANKATGLPLGMCGLVNRDTLDDVDLGFALMPHAEGQGYAAEIAAATLKHARDVLGIERVVAITDIQNERSIHLLKKIGFSFEKKVKLSASDSDINLFAINLLPVQ